MKRAGEIVLRKAVAVVKNLSEFAEKYKSLPTLGYTHLQPAQLTTVGKRATLWINELLIDIDNLSYQLDNLKLLGSKGTTGTQASFMELFGGDGEKVKELERRLHGRRVVGDRSERAEIRKRPSYSAVVRGNGRTVRKKSDRLVRNAV